MKKILSLAAALTFVVVLGGCNLATGANGVGILSHGIGLSTGYSAYYHCGQARTGAAATEYHGVETRIVNASNVPMRVSGGLINVVVPPGEWVSDCVVTQGRSQAVQYTAVGTKPNRDGRYTSDSWKAETGWEYGSINRSVWHIR